MEDEPNWGRLVNIFALTLIAVIAVWFVAGCASSAEILSPDVTSGAVVCREAREVFAEHPGALNGSSPAAVALVDDLYTTLRAGCDWR